MGSTIIVPIFSPMLLDVPQEWHVPKSRCVIFVQVENTGRYTCLATSPAGDDDKEFLVRVHGET